MYIAMGYVPVVLSIRLSTNHESLSQPIIENRILTPLTFFYFFFLPYNSLRQD